ncbi:MAG: WD40 repeat domain-containing protein [Bacteroidales bacterium]|nr:WD40 repeat domain-containing protein [Bacteroidales bacterium]
MLPNIKTIGQSGGRLKGIILILMMVAIQVLPIGQSIAQDSMDDFESLSLPGIKYMLVGLAIHPQGEKVAVSGMQSFPMYIYDWKSESIEKTFDVGNWYAGSRINYSKTGKYLILQQLYYIDWAPNKDREVNFEIIDAETGEMIKKFADYHSVSITPDEKFALTLSGEEVAFWNLQSGEKERSFRVPMASNAVAISEDMKTIAVSHKLDKKVLKKHPAMKKKKGKVIKKTAKYKQQISLYSAENFEKLNTVNEFYDIIYKLEYSPDGKDLLCLHIPHLKAQTAKQRITYINLVDAETFEPLRKGFTSTAIYEPQFRWSDDQKLFGLVSQGNRFVEIHIYDYENGNMLERFEQAYRLFEKNDDGMVMADARSGFVFLPGNEEVLMTMGNRLLKWKLNLNK